MPKYKGRAKSASDINAQVRRIQEKAEANSFRFTGGYGNSTYTSRQNKAVSIGNEYTRNIMKAQQKQGSLDYERKMPRASRMGKASGGRG